MWTRHRRKSPLRLVAIPALTIIMSGYFIYHGQHGTYGLAASERYDARIAALSAELAQLAAERAHLEKDTSALHHGSIERDMLDEQARDILGLARANELVVLHSSKR